jgi:diguanylate cyclase (GGDEF)-like protein
MAGLALVPLTGLVWFTVRVVREEARHRHDASAVVDASLRGASLVRLTAAVTEEKHWTHAVNSLEDLGVDPADVVDIVGHDIAAQLDTARLSVDLWLAAVGPNPFGEEIERLRAARDEGWTTDEITFGFEPLELAIAAAYHDEIEAAITLAAGLEGGDDLVRAARVLEGTAVMGADMSWQVGAYFGVRFEAGRPLLEQRRTLLERAASYHAQVRHVGSIVEPGSRAAVALDELRKDPGVGAFLADLDRQIEDLLSGRITDDRTEISGILDQPMSLVDTFERAVEATRRHLDLVAAAGNDVAAEARAIGTGADRELRQTIATVVLGAALTVAAAVAATRVIVGPLGRLADAAARVRSGELDVEVAERGPAELRITARAMNEAIGQLRLVEHQALALAEGATDDPVLETEAPGRLGASLQRAVARLRSSLTEREEFRNRLAHEATHDGLTGLPNRRAATTHLDQALARATRAGTSLAVLFVDLDTFKAVNDLHGHALGDRMLKEAARRIAAAVRTGDLAGRLGGDEFIVVADPVTDEEDAVALARRIIDTLRQPLTVGEVTVHPRCSVGIALPHAGTTDGSSLISDADLAVYEAKRKGGDRAEVCTEALRADVTHRAHVERELATAIATGELVVHLQPIVDAATTSPTGVEALVRWRHPTEGLLSPDAFIPVAERSNLIVEVDRWVLDAALDLAARPGGPLEGRWIAVNVSSRHLHHPDLPDVVLAALDRHGVAPERLVVEVTESALLEDLDAAVATLTALRTAGVRVAIDDFGTGYTSLAHLRTLPIDTVKIDRSYVRDLDPDDHSLVELIVGAAHTLGLRVTAEGVETPVQAEVLRALGVDELQGFLFGRPCAPAAPGPEGWS